MSEASERAGKGQLGGWASPDVGQDSDELLPRHGFRLLQRIIVWSLLGLRPWGKHIIVPSFGNSLVRQLTGMGQHMVIPLRGPDHRDLVEEDHRKAREFVR